MVNKILVPDGESLSKKLNGEDVNLPAGKWIAYEDLLKQQKEEQDASRDKTE